MKTVIRKSISYLLYYSGITFINRKIKNKKTLILAYHRVLNLNDDFVYDSGLVSASTRNFAKQMEYLSSKYNILSLNEFIDYQNKKINPPKNSIIITFDDGYLDSYTNAYPILKKYNLPAAIYLSTGAINEGNLFWWDKLSYMLNKSQVASFEIKELGKYSLNNKKKTFNDLKAKLKSMSETDKNNAINKLSKILNVTSPKNSMFLNWSQIKTMQENKISFGAHTVNHPILTNISLKEAEKEIITSKRIIENKLKTKISLFAYPNGHESDFNEDIIKILKKYKFSCATTYIPGWTDKNTNPYKLDRIFVKYEDNLIMFKNKLIGLDIFFGKIYYFFNKIRGKRR